MELNCIPQHILLLFLVDCHLTDSIDHIQNEHIPVIKKKIEIITDDEKCMLKMLSEVKLIDNNTLKYYGILVIST